MPQSANSESDPAIPHQNPDTSTLQGITNHRKEIVWNSFVVTIPISALTVAFLLLVFRYRVKTGDSPLKNLRLPSDEGDKNAVYVDLNSSYILFVASRASSLGTLLTGFILTLVSFPIARQLSRDIQMGRVDSLPTPYQLALLLKFLDGSAPGAIWGWIVYLFSWRKTRQPQSSALIAASSTASAALILG
ncbi:unnamed protein product [Penicillium salamii]|uniref:Uncharacterized protein n=1 Tax=Penicillium salamii TaxID=1612424 RepID=A0A9W4J557_9EURO|nr:unnamed protein product [Penicillium salamii]CAG8386796.1 unnamed protein product [Penicillium salamii]